MNGHFRTRQVEMAEVTLNMIEGIVEFIREGKYVLLFGRGHCDLFSTALLCYDKKREQ
jgi:hypothetical protein